MCEHSGGVVSLQRWPWQLAWRVQHAGVGVVPAENDAAKAIMQVQVDSVALKCTDRQHPFAMWLHFVGQNPVIHCDSSGVDV